MGLTFEASGGLGAPGLGAYMTVQNNGPVLGMDQWLVAWALPHDRLEAGTVDGAILVSAGANGAPLRVVNTDSNAKIPVGGSKSFSFRMEAAQVDTIGLSRAPSDLSVNGKICRPGDGRQPAELCVVPSEKPSPSASSFSGVGGGCSVEFCCGKRLEDPAKEVTEEQPFFISTWGLCETRASISQFQLQVVNSSIPLLLVTLQPSGGFSLCDVKEDLPPDTALQIILSSDSPVSVLSTGLLDASNITTAAPTPSDLSTAIAPCTAFDPQELPNIQEQYWPHPWTCLTVSSVTGSPSNTLIVQNNGTTPINMVLGSIVARSDQALAAIGGSSSMLRATTLSDTFEEASPSSWIETDVNFLYVVMPLVAVLVAGLGLNIAISAKRNKGGLKLRLPRSAGREDTHVVLFKNILSPGKGGAGNFEESNPPSGVIQIVDFEEEILLEEILGSGSFGAVHKGRLNGEPVAVKMMHSITCDRDLVNVRQEVAAMAGLGHPRVVRLLACCLEPPNVCLVQELAENGSLHSALHSGDGKGQRLNYLTLLRIATDIADGMCYLHPTIVHRDLKSQNILLDRNCRAQVCDFGIAKFKERTFLTTHKAGGTPAYMAPEMFEGSSEISEKCDVFSFAVILWEMATVQVPWEGATPMQVIFAVGVQKQRLPFPLNCPAALQRLVERCWAADPCARPGFPEILQILLVERRRALAAASTPPQQREGKDH